MSGPEVGIAVSILKAADWKGDAVISSGVLCTQDSTSQILLNNAID